MAAPVDRSEVLRGLEFHFLDWGTEGRPALVCLHGAAQTAHTWDEVAPALSVDHRVFALDQRGHGDSQWAPDRQYRREEMAADVLAFLDARRIDGATILGLSMGGLVALELALVHPERVKGLVVVDVAPRVERAGTEEIRAHLSVLEFDTFEEAVARARAFNPRRTLENLRERLRHGLRRRPDGKWVYKFDPAILAFEAAESLETLWGRLGAVRCPTLLVRGAESPLLARETAERFARELPAAELAEVPGAGHSVMGDNPQGFLAVVKPFLERHGL